jgi:HD-like signal output (HDOD) protein/CheY-like chemotaxis protein
MRQPVGVMVVVPDDLEREAVVDAVSRTGHQAVGVHSVDEARGRSGRRTAEVLLFDRRGWEDGGRAYVDALRGDGAPRVLMLADEGVLRRRDVFEDAGVEDFVAEPLSDLELLLRIDEVLDREPPEAPAASAPVHEEAAPVPEDSSEDASWRDGKDVGGALVALADALRAGKAEVSNLSPVAIELQGVVGDPDARVQDMIRHVDRDPNLVAALLRASNSAIFRGMPQVVDLQEAGRRLGTRRLGEIAQREALRGAFSSPHKGWSRVLGKMWRNTVLIAEASRTLAERMRMRRLGAIYTTGLFVDLGQVLIVDMYRKLGYPAPKDGLPRGELARELRERHAAMGVLLLKSWGMPSSVLAVALHHHDPSELPSGTPVSRHAWIIGAVSGALARKGYAPWAGEQAGPDQRLATAALGLPIDLLNEVVDAAIADWNDV